MTFQPVSPQIVATLFFLSLALFPFEAVSQEFSQTGDGQYFVDGDRCQVMNPTTKNAASLRYVNGVLKNTSEELSATISCPITFHYSNYPTSIVDFTYSDIRVWMYFLNSDSSGEKTFVCSTSFTETWDANDGTINYRSRKTGSEAVIIPPNNMKILELGMRAEVWTDPEDLTARPRYVFKPRLTCNLPPLSEVVLYVYDVRSKVEPAI